MKKINNRNYGFDIEKILLHLNKLRSVKGKISYIEEVLTECNKQISVIENTVSLVKENEMLYEGETKELLINTEGLGKVRVILELELERLKETNEGLVKENTPWKNDTNKIFVNSNLTDIIRIFEAMKYSGIISG